MPGHTDEQLGECQTSFTRVEGRLEEHGRTLGRHAQILEKHAETLAGHSTMIATQAEVVERLEQTNTKVLQQLGATQLTAAAHSEKLQDVKDELKRMNDFNARLIYLLVAALILLAGAKQVFEMMAGGV
jgi:hypothetical protein